MNDVFIEAYKNLNDEQKRAVDAIEGPVMVIAGPGTGKTSILTLRIANILRQTDTPPNGILALTFTESAVHSMRKKLVHFIGSAAYRVHIFTFHGFAQEIITRYPEYFPRIIGGIIATDSERLLIIETALSKGDFKIIRPFGDQFFYARKALSAIQDIKRDGINPAQFLEMVDEEEKNILSSDDLYHEKGRSKGLLKREYSERLQNCKKNRELAELYGLYENLLKEKNLYDYDDMLVELVSTLSREKDLLLNLQEEYLYILADEHQDANNSQNAILELLSDYQNTRNLFIVGDEKQAIYRFQGASLQNFLYFQKKFSDAEVIFLDHNYRSTQNILDASHALMDNRNVELPRPRLKRGSREEIVEKPIHITKYPTEDDELMGLVEHVSKQIASGVLPEDIAVLVRTNREIESVGKALLGFKIPHTLFTDDDVLADPDIEKLLIVLRAIVYPENDQLVGSMFLVDFLGLNPIDAIALNRFAFENRISSLEALSNSVIRERLRDKDSVAQLEEKFLIWKRASHNESAVDAFLKIVNGSGFQEYLLHRKESLEKVEKLTKLYDEIKSFLTSNKGAKLQDFIVSIDTLIRHGNPISFSKRSLGLKGVSVMTAHKSKGLEWRSVYITNGVDTVWGNRRRIAGFRLPYPLGAYDEQADNEDERRLFYVALTRAKENVFISYCELDKNSKERIVSEFVSELPNDLVVFENGKSYPIYENLNRALKEEESVSRTVWDREYLRQLFEDQGLNPTALNGYLRCPWQYFFKNLVRLPDIPEKYLHFGNAVHAGLKTFADKKREGEIISSEDVLDVFEKFLKRMPLSKKDLQDSLEKGREILPKYLNQYNQSWHKDVITEFAINGVSLKLSDSSEVLIRGRIDKIELYEDGTANVVDYKTGSRKTRNEILGNTKSSNGDMKRQLDFYKLLLDTYDDGKFQMISGDIDFVEPDAKGVFHKEHFEITREDGRAVGELVGKVAQEIRSFSFWGKTCDNSDCEFCKLKKVLIDSAIK